MGMGNYTRNASSGGNGQWFIKNDGFKVPFGNITRICLNADDKEPAGTQFKIYARRAY